MTLILTIASGLQVSYRFTGPEHPRGQYGKVQPQPTKAMPGKKKSKRHASKKEKELASFRKFMTAAGFPPKAKKPHFPGWVRMVQGGSPGLGK